MVYIPTDKAVVAVQINDDERYCKRDCVFYNNETSAIGCPACHSDERKDGKDVIFKFIDYNT